MTPGSKEHAAATAEEIGKAAMALHQLAQMAGLLVTINTKPLTPLAMGNYRIEIEIRPTHHAYRSAQ
jgi:hypothetical protein